MSQFRDENESKSTNSEILSLFNNATPSGDLARAFSASSVAITNSQSGKVKNGTIRSDMSGI